MYLIPVSYTHLGHFGGSRVGMLYDIGKRLPRNGKEAVFQCLFHLAGLVIQLNRAKRKCAEERLQLGVQVQGFIVQVVYAGPDMVHCAGECSFYRFQSVLYSWVLVDYQKLSLIHISGTEQHSGREPD